MRFFFYGTLMDTDVRDAVLGRRDAAISVEPALLEGYRRVTMRGRSYPVAIARRGHSIEGVLARGLNAADFERLTRFEGGEYRALECRVSIAPGRRRAAWTYIASAAAALTVEAWSFESWQRRHKAVFLRRFASDREV